MSDGSETDNRRLLERIKNVLPKLNKEGKRKGASEKRCMITLYAASSLTNLKYKGYINKRDGFRYFSISTLRDIAKNEEKILGPDVDIPFDTDTAKKIFKILEQQDGYVKFLSKKNISKDICRGDTSPITITKKGENYCRRLIDELIDEQRLIQYASTSDKVHDDLTQVQQNYGLNWLSPGFFESHRCTENDFDDWKKGFSFRLTCIKAGRELRRDGVIADIKGRLEKEGKLLITGRPGSSKTTVFMEIICDYLDEDFAILYNEGTADIKNPDGLVSFIDDLLRDGNKILVAIDNEHDERTSPIFYVIDKLSSSQLAVNLRFFITARMPEFELFVKDRLDTVQEELRKSIRKLVGAPKFRYDMPYFSKDDVKEFVKRYEEISNESKVEKISQEIYDYTKGDPVMVKFSVFRQGLNDDVAEMYNRYLRSQLEMKTMLICSLLDILNIEITDTVLEKCGVLTGAYNLDGATLIHSYDGPWRTKHTRWDLELFSFLYNENNRALVESRKQALKESLLAIYIIRQEKITYAAIWALYYIARQKFIPINIVESVFQQSLSQTSTFLSNVNASTLYAPYIAEAYHVLEKYQEAIDKSNEALRLNSRNAMAYNSKGLALTELKRYDEAVECFDRALEINPKLSSVWMHKGNALDYLGSSEKAMSCYDMALEIDPGIPGLLIFINKGACLHHLGRDKDAVECFDKALRIVRSERPAGIEVLGLGERDDYMQYMNLVEAQILFLKGDSLQELGKHEDAVEVYCESLKLNPVIAETWRTKAKSLAELGRYRDAIEAENELLNLKPADAKALLRKGMLHAVIDEYIIAAECFDQVLKIEPDSAEAWHYKGLIQLKTGGSDAQECLNKAKELGFHG